MKAKYVVRNGESVRKWESGKKLSHPSEDLVTDSSASTDCVIPGPEKGPDAVGRSFL
jgi:hypothetical protein